MSKVRICFLGTPDFAVDSLKGLLKDDHFDVVGVVTQPDRPSGRKLVLTPSPVKVLALAKGLKVISPESVNQTLILQEIERWGAEVAVVVAFGQILSDDFIKLFPFGAVNIHASVLPRWRGAAPIQRAIQEGDRETGVTLQKIVRELDAGDIIGIRKIIIDDQINSKELHDQLAALGADLLHVELMDYLRGNLAPVSQPTMGITHAKKMRKEEGQILWKMSARQIHNQVRAFVLGPGTWVVWKEKKLKIHKTRVVDDQPSLNGAPGEILEIEKGEIWVQTKSGILALLEVQPESRNKMKAEEFIKGYELKKGMKLNGA